MPGRTREPIHRALSVAIQYKTGPNGGVYFLPGTHKDPPKFMQILTGECSKTTSTRITYSRFRIELLHFREGKDRIVVLMDDNTNPDRQPTYENIVSGRLGSNWME